MESPYGCNFDYNYAHPKAVVFPVPPPTTNALSSGQRARLLRSSKKIARVLGTTPHFVDLEGYARGNDGIFVPNPRSVSRASSIESNTSVSSCSTTLTSTSHTSASTSATSASSTRSLSRPRKSLPLTPSQKGWPTRKPPMLRLSLETSLESIPASPRTPLNHGRTMTIRHRRSSPLDGTPFDSPSHDKCAELNSPESSPTAVSFVIPSRATTRRRKMDRVRRLLGEEVPVRLVFPPSSGSDNDSDSGSEPSLTSGGKTSSDDDLSTPNTSPVSPTSPLFDVETPNAMEKPLPMIPRTPPRKKKIANARDSLVLPSSPLKSPRTSRTFVVPQASRPAPPPPKLPPVSPKTKSNFMMPQRNPIPAPYKTLSAKATSPKAFVSPQIYEHPPIVHHRSNSGGSARTRLGLGVILEEKAESEWYGSDDECDADYEFVRDDEVLGTVGGWGNGGAFLYHGPLGKGMGRGLARSYGKRVSGLA